MTPEPGDLARVVAVLGGDAPLRFQAPGRVNLMGDHTDYHEGLVLPMAIDRRCTVAARSNGDEVVRVRSLDLEGDAVSVPADGSAAADEVEPPWGRLVAGVAAALAERGRAPVGVDAVLTSTVPDGSGLSSSAAFEVALALALGAAAGEQLKGRQLALACQRAEHLGTGVPSGIMDQLASVAGRAGSALLIDCRTLETRPVPLPDTAEVLVVHSGLRRTLAGSAYAERRRDSEADAAELGLESLRDATREQVADRPLARHVVSENERVLQTAAALASGDGAEAGRLFLESHASLRDDYRVSTPELDALVEALVDAGALGARLTGAGFGGCVVALTRLGEADAVADDATARYRSETGREPTAFVCRAADGAGPLPDA